MITKDEFLDLIEEESSSVQHRLVLDFTTYVKYMTENKGSNCQDFVNYRLSKVHTYGSERTIICGIRKLFNYLNLDDSYVVYKKIKPKSKVVAGMYCTLEYLLNLDVMNSIDKITLLSYFYGMTDDELLNITVRDIDIYNKTIRYKEKDLNLGDDRIVKLLNDAIHNDRYIAASGEEFSLTRNTLNLYRGFNDNILFTHKDFDEVINRINNNCGLHFTRESLLLSGIAHKLYKYNSNKEYWDVKRISRWKCENDLLGKFNSSRIYEVLDKLY